MTHWRRGLNISTSCSDFRPSDYDANHSWLFRPDPNQILASFPMFHQSHQYFALFWWLNSCQGAFYQNILLPSTFNVLRHKHTFGLNSWLVSESTTWIWIKSATRRPLCWAKRKIPKMCSQCHSTITTTASMRVSESTDLYDITDSTVLLAIHSFRWPDTHQMECCLNLLDLFHISFWERAHRECWESL